MSFSATTPLTALVEHLRQTARSGDGEEAPAAILWTDPDRAWEQVHEQVRGWIPELLALGTYDPEAGTGPAIWLRWALEFRKGDAPPILYLPGVGRDELRSGEACPAHLRPLVELLYRGKPWLQKNGKDWTPTAFLGSEDGLGLDLPADSPTRAALLRALGDVMDHPVERLRGRRLDISFLHGLRISDPDRELLGWMGAPEQTRTHIGDDWGAFSDLCRSRLGFDPDEETPLEAGPKLVAGAGNWASVWNRYADAPENFPGVERVLRQSQPDGKPFMVAEGRWPNENDRLEAELRQALDELPKLAPSKACESINRLEKEHGKRRAWIWARLGHAPLAEALLPLSRLADGVCSPFGGSHPDDFRSAWEERSLEVDAASWEAVAAAGDGHAGLVGRVVSHILRPWLDESARTFQDAVARTPLPAPHEQPPVEAPEGGCLFFVDALRADLGKRLADRLQESGYSVEMTTRWNALPSVTATAKPSVTPLAEEFEGGALDESLAPAHRDAKKPLAASDLRARMRERGYQILEGAEPPEAAHGWAETGSIDKAGHAEQSDFPHRIGPELERVARRVRELLDAGWTSVRIVTDHGWLFLPGGLPKVDLPKHLTATRWARAAVLSGDRDPGVPRFPWTWNPGQWFATPPGIACFNKSDAFVHGGVSLQECLTPDILIESGNASGASIVSVSWRGLRCIVEAARGSGLRADLRLGGAGGASVAAKRKPVGDDGKVSLVLADDDFEGKELTVVLLDESDHPVAMRATRGGTS